MKAIKQLLNDKNRMYYFKRSVITSIKIYFIVIFLINVVILTIWLIQTINGFQFKMIYFLNANIVASSVCFAISIIFIYLDTFEG